MSLWVHPRFCIFRFIRALLFSFQADMMKQGFSNQRQLLVTASTSQKPSDVGQTHLLLPKPRGSSLHHVYRFSLFLTSVVISTKPSLCVCVRVCVCARLCVCASSSSGSFRDSAAADLYSHPAGPKLPRAEPHVSTVQPPLCCERECARPRLGRHGEMAAGKCLDCGLCVCVCNCWKHFSEPLQSIPPIYDSLKLVDTINFVCVCVCLRLPNQAPTLKTCRMLPCSTPTVYSKTTRRSKQHFLTAVPETARLLWLLQI